VAINGHRVLTHTYIFSFYFRDGSEEKQLYEEALKRIPEKKKDKRTPKEIENFNKNLKELENNCKKYEKAFARKELYEYQLKMLSDKVDQLTELLESKELEKIFSIKEYDKFKTEFYKYRSHVIELTVAISKFMKGITEEVELNLIEFIDYNKLLNGK